MLKKLDKFAVFSAIFYIAVFLFWWLFKSEALYYQEIYQMFLWTGDYFYQLAKIPGGMADYLSEFLVQFYYYPAAGAAIVAAELTAIMLICRRISVLFVSDSQPNIILAIPSLFMWFILWDVNIMHNNMVAIIMSLLSAWAYISIMKSSLKWLRNVIPLIIGAGYFLWGPAIIIALIVGTVYCRNKKMGQIYNIVSALVLILTVTVAIHFVMYPIPRFFYGIDYFRYHDFSLYVWIEILLAAIAPMLRIKWLESCNIKSLSAQAIFFVATISIIFYAYSSNKYEVIRFMKLAQQCKWKEIVEIAEKTKPKTLKAMQLVNLALAFEHKLADQMFRFPQEGTNCLLPVLENDMLSPLLVSEGLFWMGLNDHAMHYYFESMEGNPTYRLSSFTTMRLAECYILDGDIVVADKYLQRMSKSLFYKERAEYLRNLIATNKINDDPFFKVLSQLQLKEDGVQSVNQFADSFEMLLKENPKNYLAFEYLMGFKLLEGDLKGIAQTVNLGNALGYKQLPTHIQEAMVIFWYQNHNNSLKGIPSVISQDVIARFNMKIVKEDSYWNYMGVKF